MPIRPLNRELTWLLPPSLDELIPPDHPARFVAAFVDGLGRATWWGWGVDLDGDPLGAPAYDPRGLLCVWLYGFMTGTRSSRKMEAACRDQIPYLWLTGWQHPDHNTLCRFYGAHRQDMRQLFKKTVKVAVKMGLVDLALQAVDGTKVAASASRSRTYDAVGLERLLERTDQAIEDLEKQNEEGNDPPPVHLPEELTKAKRLAEKVKAAMERLEDETGRERINLTDGDSKVMKTRQGVVPAYNVQAVVSSAPIEGMDKPALIVTAVDVVDEVVDTNQLVPILEQAEETTGKRIDTAADAGYHSGANLDECEQRKQKIVMPESQDKALQKPYHKNNFIYDEIEDTYLCPEGQTLDFRGMQRTRDITMRLYRAVPEVCRQCSAFGRCTRDYRHGRALQVGPYEAVLRRHRQLMATEEARSLYRRRKVLAEPAFGIIKEQLGLRRFLTRGLDNVKAEAALIATAFNLRGLWRAFQGKLGKKWGSFTGALGKASHRLAAMTCRGLPSRPVDTPVILLMPMVNIGPTILTMPVPTLACPATPLF